MADAAPQSPSVARATAHIKLACLRCKSKKIKCDRGEPICHQCVLSRSECIYVGRRKRAKIAQHNAEVSSLNSRLESIERLVNRYDRGAICLTDEDSHEERVSAPSPRVSPMASVANEEDQDSWIYRMARDTKRNFEKCSTNPLNTPTNTTPTTHMDSAMGALDEALERLGHLKVRPGNDLLEGDLLNLTREEASKCVDSFIYFTLNVVMPNTILRGIDFNLLKALPTIYQSPFVSVDPGLRVLFYNALFHGISDLFGIGSPLVQAAYKKILEITPKWLESAAGGYVDCHTAMVTTWTSIIMLDYHLAWQFHCKCCHFLQMQGVDRIDATPAKTAEEEEARRDYRYLYYHVLQTDALFRLCYGKPGAMRWSHSKVNPPAIITSSNMQPKASEVILTAVIIISTTMITDLLEALDPWPANSDALINDVCLKIDGLIRDYDLEARVRDEETPPNERFLYADHLMSLHIFTIGIHRKLETEQKDCDGTEAVKIRATRKTLDILLYLDEISHGLEKGLALMHHHFITFFPFCAIFTLYEYILNCPNAAEREQDLGLLERISDAMKRAASKRSDFLPFSNTVAALNKVSRLMLAEKTGEISSVNNTLPSFTTPQTNLHPTPTQPSLISSRGYNLPSAPTNDSSFVASMQQDLTDSGFTFLQEFSNFGDGNFEPQGLIKAAENDFMGRNWHESWWDMSEDMNTRVPDVNEMEH